MKIKTRLYLSSLVSIFLIVALIVVIIITATEIYKQNTQRAESRQTLQAVSELDILSYTYLLRHEKQAEQQWQAKYNSLGKILILLQSNKDKEETAAVDQLIKSYKTINTEFSELKINYQKKQELIQQGSPQEEIDANTAIENGLVNELLMDSQSIINEASQLAEKNVSDMLKAQTAGGQLTLALGIIMLVSGFITILFVDKIIAKTLHELHVGTDRIGKGDLSYKIGIKSKDEIGQLARTFNKMTTNLKSIIATKIDMEKEIKKRKKAEEALRKSDKLLNKTQEIAHLGSWEFDIVSKNRYWSDETYRIYGYKPRTIVPSHKAFLDVVHPDDQKISDTAYNNSLKDNLGGYSAEYRIIKKSTGEERILYDKCEHIRNSSGKIIRSIGMVQDVTERRNLDQRKDDFITIAGHELRTPVSAIKLVTQVLQGMLAKHPEATRYLKKIEDQSNIQANLINDLLSVSKIQTGKLEIRKEEFKLQDLIDDVAEDIQKTTLEHKIIIKNKVYGKMFTDKEKVRQVLVNFCTNAIKFSPKGEKIIINVRKNKKNITVGVTDYGVGIPKAHQGKIFHRFYRVYGSGDKAYPGLGMGLYISYQIIKLLGGDMWFKSTSGKGSTFYFSLPLSG